MLITSFSLLICQLGEGVGSALTVQSGGSKRFRRLCAQQLFLGFLQSRGNCIAEFKLLTSFRLCEFMCLSCGTNGNVALFQFLERVDALLKLSFKTPRCVVDWDQAHKHNFFSCDNLFLFDYYKIPGEGDEPKKTETRCGGITFEIFGGGLA